jgi:hypothetical protein
MTLASKTNEMNDLLENSRDARLLRNTGKLRTLVGFGVVRVWGFDAGASDESAEGIFAAGAALRANDEAIAVDDHVNGIGVCLVHGGDIGVFHHDDFAVARMLLEIFLTVFLDSPTLMARRTRPLAASS